MSCNDPATKLNSFYTTPQGFKVSCVENDDYNKFFSFIENTAFENW